MMSRGTRGFTLVEIMIVVVVIGIILAIAIPNFTKSSLTSQKTACIANMKKIDAAADQWALDKASPLGSSIDEEEVYSKYLRNGKPKCPSGGEYALHMVGDNPQVTCSKEDEGHKLP